MNRLIFEKILGKQQKSFVLNSLIVFGFSIISLQTLLLFLPVGIATFLSQIIYISFAIRFYGKNVFNIKKIKKIYIFKFYLMVMSLWIINWLGTNLFNTSINNINLSSALMIPILAVISFVIQKYIIFK